MAHVQAPPSLSVPHAAQLFRLLGDESRLRLLLLLAERGEISVGDLAGEIGLSLAAVSSHLMLLRASGLVDFRREGLRNFYRLSSPLVVDWLHEVCGA
jgi:DNA-binding transcriptional ArsR family regulator